MEQHFYADAEKITIWSPVQNQVIISANQQNDDISLADRFTKFTRKYVIQLWKRRDPKLAVFLQTKKRMHCPGDFHCGLTRPSYFTTSGVKTENALTTVKFANMSLNPNFEETEFVFVPPKGADIQDSRCNTKGGTGAQQCPKSILLAWGVPKSVDSEVMLGQLTVIMVDRRCQWCRCHCGQHLSFIQSATEESIETILEMAQKKADANAKSSS